MRWTAIAVLCLVAACGAAADRPPAPAGTAIAFDADYRSTQRRPSELFEKMVARPLALVRAGNLAAAERKFETMLADALSRPDGGPLAAADLLTAFGIKLYEEGSTLESAIAALDDALPGGELHERSVTYLRRAVPHFRAALGPDHPEVALALNSLADAMIEGNPAGWSREEAEAALAEALRIRRASLGELHVETVGALVSLAEMRGRSDWIGGDPARLNAAVETYEQLLAFRLRLGPNSEVRDVIPIRVEFGELLAENRREATALAQARMAVEAMIAQAEGGIEGCFDAMMMSHSVAALFERLGKEAEAIWVRQRFRDCFDREGAERRFVRAVSRSSARTRN